MSFNDHYNLASLEEKLNIYDWILKNNCLVDKELVQKRRDEIFKQLSDNQNKYRVF